jgi:hypothetical protein
MHFRGIAKHLSYTHKLVHAKAQTLTVCSCKTGFEIGDFGSSLQANAYVFVRVLRNGGQPTSIIKRKGNQKY